MLQCGPAEVSTSENKQHHPAADPSSPPSPLLQCNLETPHHQGASALPFYPSISICCLHGCRSTNVPPTTKLLSWQRFRRRQHTIARWKGRLAETTDCPPDWRARYPQDLKARQLCLFDRLHSPAFFHAPLLLFPSLYLTMNSSARRSMASTFFLPTSVFPISCRILSLHATE